MKGEKEVVFFFSLTPFSLASFLSFFAAEHFLRSLLEKGILVSPFFPALSFAMGAHLLSASRRAASRAVDAALLRLSSSMATSSMMMSTAAATTAGAQSSSSSLHSPLLPLFQQQSKRSFAADAAYDINTRSKAHLNIGTIGHVDHGKTTLTAAITKVRLREKKERKGGRNKGAAAQRVGFWTCEPPKTLSLFLSPSFCAVRRLADKIARPLSTPSPPVKNKIKNHQGPGRVGQVQGRRL